MKEYNSVDMALKAIMWLKLKKGCFLHCTEFGYYWRADAIGTNGTDLYEIEIKTSWTDFKADFRNKVAKHESFADPEKKIGGYHNYKPNYLWFLVTEDLKEKAVEYIKKEANPNYGVLYMDKNGEIWSAKNVKRLHSEPLKERVKNQMIGRMSNEYTYLIENLRNELRYKVTNFFDQLLVDAADSYKEKSVDKK